MKLLLVRDRPGARHAARKQGALVPHRARRDHRHRNHHRRRLDPGRSRRLRDRSDPQCGHQFRRWFSRFRLGPAFGGRTPEELLRKPLTYEDAVAIAERCPSVEHVSPYLLPPIMRGGRARPRPLQGQRRVSDPDWRAPTNITPPAARPTSRPAVSSPTPRTSTALPVAVIGEDVLRVAFRHREGRWERRFRWTARKWRWSES